MDSSNPSKVDKKTDCRVGPPIDAVIGGIFFILSALAVLTVWILVTIYCWSAVETEGMAEFFMYVGFVFFFPLIIAGAFFFWGLSKFKSVSLEYTLKQLNDQRMAKRRAAAELLLKTKSEGKTPFSRLDLLLKAGKYQEALNYREEAICKMSELLQDESINGHPILLAITNSKTETAVDALIALLEKKHLAVSKDQIVATLRGLTDEDFGEDQDAWRKWSEKQTYDDESKIAKAKPSRFFWPGVGLMLCWYFGLFSGEEFVKGNPIFLILAGFFFFIALILTAIGR